MTDLSVCPGCGGVADQGHDRCLPPSPYFCTKCDAEEYQMTDHNCTELLKRLDGEPIGKSYHIGVCPEAAAAIRALIKERDELRTYMKQCAIDGLVPMVELPQ